jgi:hypothetical protein
MNLGADQGMLLTVHKMMVPSALEFSSSSGQEPLDSKLNWSKPSKRRDCKSSRECTLTDL